MDEIKLHLDRGKAEIVAHICTVVGLTAGAMNLLESGAPLVFPALNFAASAVILILLVNQKRFEGRGVRLDSLMFCIEGFTIELDALASILSGGVRPMAVALLITGLAYFIVGLVIHPRYHQKPWLQFSNSGVLIRINRLRRRTYAWEKIEAVRFPSQNRIELDMKSGKTKRFNLAPFVTEENREAIQELARIHWMPTPRPAG